MAHNGTIGRNAALVALMNAATVKEAAADSGISERTLWRRLAEPEFVEELRRAEETALDQACRRLAAGTGDALDVLHTVMLGDAPDGVRVRAATTWIDAALKWLELRHILDRVERLERAMLQNGGGK